jgi:hypothetical protein
MGGQTQRELLDDIIAEDRVRVIGNVVPLEYTARSMARDLHNHSLGDARASQRDRHDKQQPQEAAEDAVEIECNCRHPEC